MDITCISDLHGFLPELDGGDLLVLAGDYTASDKLNQWAAFFQWLKKQDYRKKIIIAGNHDNFLYTGLPKNQKEADELKEVQELLQEIDEIGDVDFEYLCDSGTEFEGLKIWGTPWSSRFLGINPKCTAFTYFDEARHYDEHIMKIPQGTDILITHEPAFGVLDGIPQEDGSIFHVGNKGLYGWLKYIERPKLHIFGHIHEAYGQQEYFPTYDDKMMISINCSYVNEYYKPVNKPIRIEL